MKLGQPLLCLAALAGTMTLCAAAAHAGDAQSGVVPDIAIGTVSDPNEALRFARSHIADRDMRGAVFGLQRYLDHHPDESVVEEFLGDLYLRSGDPRDAQAIYEHMIESASPLDASAFNRELHSRLGRVYAIEGMASKAIGELNVSLPNLDSIYWLVQLHAQRGDLDAFRQQLRDNALAHPSDVNAQLDAGQLFGALYLPRDAAVEFQRAAQLDPHSVDALEGLALSQAAEGADAAAHATLTQCLTLDAKNYGCLVALGMLETDEAKYDDAQTTLERAYDLAPESPDAIISMAQIADDRGMWQNATALYERALYVWPFDGDAYAGIALDDEEHGNIAAATQTTLDGLTRAPDDGSLHYMLGYFYHVQGNNALALQQFTLAAQSLNPQVSQFAKQMLQQLQSPSSDEPVILPRS